jgi:hypothetical protein
MAWITVNVVCVTEDIEYNTIEKANTILESLALPLKELPPVKTDIREAEMNTEHIVTYYSSHDLSKTIVECINGNYSVAMEKTLLKHLIKQSEVNG